MKYYIVSDIHGYYTHLKNALAEVGFFEENKPCKLVVCGDLLDRGAEVIPLIEFMLQLAEQDKLIYVLGNHEELLVQCLQYIAAGGVYDVASGMSYHYRNKTWDTILQISGMNESEACNNSDELIRRVMCSPFYDTLLPSCVDYYETSHYIFTHGYIPCFKEGEIPNVKYSYNPEWRNADISEWHDARWFNGMDIACNHRVTEPNKTIVCGHWHVSYGHSQIEHSGSEWGENANFSPFRAEGILAIDACTTRSARVNCIVIED